MPSSPLTYVPWFLGPAIQLAAIIFMKRRRLYESYSVFFTYNIFSVVTSLVLFAIHATGNDEAYFLAYWVNSALTIGLGFFVIREVFINMLKPYVGLRDAGMLLFRWAALLLVLFSAASYASGKGSGLARIIREITVMERNILLIQCGLLLFVVMCSNYLNISWKGLPCGIAFGFGAFAVNDLLVANMLPLRGWVVEQHTITVISQFVWCASTAVWLGYTIFAQAEKKLVHDLAFRPAVDRWNQAAMLIMNSEPDPDAHTYLSDIERTVESVMAHSTIK